MFKSHNSRGFLICFGVTIMVLFVYMFGWLDALELKSIDWRFNWRGNRPVNTDIVVVAIDEDSQAALGRWPWPRRVHGLLVRKLTAAGARAITFDSIFSEADRTNPASDAEFARAVRDSGRVVLAFHFKDGIEDRINGAGPLFPYEALRSDAYVGFVNFDPDPDGINRRSYLYLLDGENVYPSLEVATYALLKGKAFSDVISELPIVISRDPIDASNELFINYTLSAEDGDYPYKTYSYGAVLDGTVKPSEFKDKIVYVGATSAGLGDVKAVPFLSKYPGVMLRTNVLDNLLSGGYLHGMSGYLTALYVLLLGVGLGFLLPRLSTGLKLAAFLFITGGGVAAAFWAFKAHNYVVQIVPPFLTGFASYIGILFYRVVVEEREKRKIKGSFRQYLSPKIVEIITKDPSKLKLGGEEREVSIFFLDIAGFTAMSEALKPSQLVEVMNECLSEFSDIIFKHDGLINKYIGDCIMAFWNAPADQPAHATQACLAALDCINALPDLNRRFQEKGLPSIDCRVGINTGLVVVGNMGSREKFDYTVMGDPVNLASRMEGANKQYHTHIMISDVTFDRAKADIEARDLDLIRVKGKKEPRKVFEVLGRKDALSEEMRLGRQVYHEALKLYRDQKFAEAVTKFEAVFDYLPNDPVAKIYIDRARAFMKDPAPAGWDGVFELKTK